MEIQTSIRIKHKDLIHLNDQLRIIVNGMIEDKPKINTIKDGIACFILAKSYKTHGAIMKLVLDGYSEDADMLVRTLFDAYLIIAATLKDETDNTAFKFIRFDDELRTKMFNTIKNQSVYQKYLQDRKDNPKPNDESVELISERASKWLEDYGNDFWQRWHNGKTTGQLADSVEMKKYFETAYSLQSQLIHSLPRTMDFYFKENGEEIFMDVEPKDRGVDLSLISSLNMLFATAKEFNSYFKLEYRAELEVLVNKLSQVVNNI